MNRGPVKKGIVGRPQTLALAVFEIAVYETAARAINPNSRS
jgi:hypothetical protein